MATVPNARVLCRFGPRPTSKTSLMVVNVAMIIRIILLALSFYIICFISMLKFKPAVFCKLLCLPTEIRNRLQGLLKTSKRGQDKRGRHISAAIPLYGFSCENVGKLVTKYGNVRALNANGCNIYGVCGLPVQTMFVSTPSGGR